jgi:hypothetical protein
MALPSEKGDGFPFSLWNMTNQPLAARAAAPDTDHIRGDRRLVDKDQPRRIQGSRAAESSAAALALRLFDVARLHKGFFL